MVAAQRTLAALAAISLLLLAVSRAFLASPPARLTFFLVAGSSLSPTSSSLPKELSLSQSVPLTSSASIPYYSLVGTTPARSSRVTPVEPSRRPSISDVAGTLTGWSLLAWSALCVGFLLFAIFVAPLLH